MYNLIRHRASRFLPLILNLAAPFAHAEKLIPAGSVVQCTVSERISSLTVAVGDPVLCQVSRTNGFPGSTQLSGRFEEYKDPGHLVGKGWIELVFDRVILPSNETIPINARVIAVPHYHVDLEGKIKGNGHAVRDTFEWLIPVLWPLDVINLPRRGPRPTLKNESRLTLKVMDDLMVPEYKTPLRDGYGFSSREVSRVDEQPTMPVYDPGTLGEVFMAGPHSGDLVRPIFRNGSSVPNAFNVSNGQNGVEVDRGSDDYRTYMAAYKTMQLIRDNR